MRPRRSGSWFSILSHHLAAVWCLAALAAGGLGALMAGLILPEVAWKAVGAGWVLALGNSLLALWLNRRAIGRSRQAFIGWGLVAHAFRLLTLVLIFAFIASRYHVVRGAFFVAVFVGFFVLLGVEVAGLLKSQSRNVN